MTDQQAPQRPRQPAQQSPRPAAAQQARPQRGELTRDELRAHLANVESQVKSALRIIASESKGTQQAHSALRADLSSALVRLQADMNGSASELSAKIDRLGAEVSFLSRQRRIGRIILATFGMTLSFVLGVLVIVTWLLVKEGMFQNASIPMPIEDMLKRENAGAAPGPGVTNAPAEATSPVPVPETSAPRSPQQGDGLLPSPVQRQPIPPGSDAQLRGGMTPPAPLPNTETEQELPPNLLLPDQTTQ